jgi:hypothetical protein
MIMNYGTRFALGMVALLVCLAYPALSPAILLASIFGQIVYLINKSAHHKNDEYDDDDND